MSGPTVTLYATRKGGGGATGGGELVKLVDSSGYNGAFSGTPTVLATAATNQAFRGVALAPQPLQKLPDLTIGVMGPSSAAVNVPYNYTVTVNNGGAVNATSVTAQFTLPAGVTFNNASGTGFSCSQANGVITCSGGTVNAGSSVSISVNVTPTGTGTVTVPAGAAVVDPSNTITESNETNNSSTSTVSTTIFSTPLTANNDSYNTNAGSALNVTAAQGVLANDAGSPLSVINHTAPTNGTLSINANGSFTYTPDNGFFGKDTFTYTITDAAQTFRMNNQPLATIGGVNVTGDGFGSSLAPVPGSSDEYYGLTDRGPNVDGPSGTKVEPMPAFNPAIGKFKLTNGQAQLEQTIPLQAADGTPYSGRVNSQASTGETITDLNGNVLPPDPNGYDSEGLVALADGTFWVSDEYGPFITHFDATGKQIGRLSPFDASLPVELKFRLANRGMEGLTITPDGSTLVGMMQSALMQTDIGSTDPKKIAIVRLVTYTLTGPSAGALHEYLYLLDNPVTTKTAVSELTALSNTTFLVDERDGNFPPGAYKKVFQINISGATDVGPASTVGGATYNGANGGLLIGGKTLENLAGTQNTSQTTTTLSSNSITPVGKTLKLDVGAVLDQLDPQGGVYSHDKIEGLGVLGGGNQLILSNDSDFGIDGLTNSTPPFQLHAKTAPATGQVDFSEFIVIDLTRLPARTSTATVTINVNALPVASNDAADVPFNTPTDIGVLANDTDADGGTLTITNVTQGTHGAVAINAGNTTVRYTPDSNFAGTDSFTYTISDGQGGSARERPKRRGLHNL